MVRVDVYTGKAGERVEMFARRYGRGTACVVRQAGVPDRLLTTREAVKRVRREIEALGLYLVAPEPEPRIAWLARIARLPFRLRPA